MTGARSSLVAAVILLFGATHAVRAQEVSDTPSFKSSELFFVFGWGKGFERTPLNAPAGAGEEQELGSGFSFGLGYLYSFTENFGLGAHIYGILTKTGEYTYTRDNVQRRESFVLGIGHFGVEARWTFVRGAVEPAAFLALNYAGGTLTSEESRKLGLYGVSGGGGALVGIRLASDVLFCVKGYAFAGSAQWTDPPFVNSTSKNITPAVIGLNAGIQWAFD